MWTELQAVGEWARCGHRRVLGADRWVCMGHGLVQVWAQAGPQVESVVCRRWWGGGGMAEQTALFPGEAGAGGNARSLAWLLPA